MRMTIAAGLIMGVALGIQAAHDAHFKTTVSRAASVVRVRAIAPWYIATNAENGSGSRGTPAGSLRC